MILLIDNYDSFTFNLAHLIAMAGGGEPAVLRNDAKSVDDILALRPEAVVLSPGPKRPEDAGVCMELIRRSGEIPLFGVCLGHQAIAAAHGGTVAPAGRLMHGKVDHVRHDGRGLFEGVAQDFPATRYHSLSVLESDLPGDLRVTARADDGEIMALEHAHRPLFGVQFHPESVATEAGAAIMANFLKRARTPA